MSSRIETTLYDLISSIQDVVEPDEDELVVATVMYLLGSGRIKMLRARQELPCHVAEIGLGDLADSYLVALVISSPY